MLNGFCYMLFSLNLPVKPELTWTYLRDLGTVVILSLNSLWSICLKIVLGLLWSDAYSPLFLKNSACPLAVTVSLFPFPPLSGVEWRIFSSGHLFLNYSSLMVNPLSENWEQIVERSVMKEKHAEPETFRPLKHVAEWLVCWPWGPGWREASLWPAKARFQGLKSTTLALAFSRSSGLKEIMSLRVFGVIS